MSVAPGRWVVASAWPLGLALGAAAAQAAPGPQTPGPSTPNPGQAPTLPRSTPRNTRDTPLPVGPGGGRRPILEITGGAGASDVADGGAPVVGVGAGVLLTRDLVLGGRLAYAHGGDRGAYFFGVVVQARTWRRLWLGGGIGVIGERGEPMATSTSGTSAPGAQLRADVELWHAGALRLLATGEATVPVVESDAATTVALGLGVQFRP